MRALVALLLCACGTPEPIDLKVATINLRNASDWWQERFELIEAEIDALGADMIGMQEVEFAQEQAELLQSKAAIPYEVHQEMKTGLAALSGEGIALFSRKPIVSRSMIDLLYGRPAIIDRIALDEDFMLTFVNTHLHHQGGDEVRLPQMQAILAEIADETGPVI